MGWKSTVFITRDEALQLIMKRLLSASDEELADVVGSLGYGDNKDLEHYGRNFMVVDKEEIED